MHVPRTTADHALKRNVVLDSFEKRQLLGSILGDVLNPIVTPLLGGHAGSPTTTATPTPPPTSSPSSGGGNGNGGGNGSGSSGNGSGSSGNGSGNGGGSSGNGNGGGGNGNGDGGQTSSSGGGGTTGTPNGSGSNTSAGSPPGASVSSGGSGPASTPVSSGPSASNSPSDGNSSSPVAVANVGADPTPTQSSSIKGAPGRTTPSTGSSYSTSSSGSNDTGSGAISGPSGSQPSQGSSKISHGAIAGIAVVCMLAVLLLLVICIRKRAILRRSERRSLWWTGNSLNASPTPRPGTGGADSVGRSRASVRSSFETTVDHALTPQLTLNFGDAPPLPPMIEVHSEGASVSRLVSPTHDTPVLISFDNSHVQTLPPQSVHSRPSDESHSQYSEYITQYLSPLTLPQEPSTPMSVRPFSPSESFSFPKPPPPTTADNTTNSDVRSPQTSMTSNPFDDPATVAPEEEIEIEIVCRPFIPTRHDELHVSLGDTVKIVQLFDDGWALVEKVGASAVGHNGPSTVGLIPMDCFRAPGQDLPSFFSEKNPHHVAPYSGDVDLGTAM